MYVSYVLDLVEVVQAIHSHLELIEEVDVIFSIYSILAPLPQLGEGVDGLKSDIVSVSFECRWKFELIFLFRGIISIRLYKLQIVLRKFPF